MDLTIVGCGYVGLALAERLQPRRPQLKLTLTTTSSERLELSLIHISEPTRPS